VNREDRRESRTRASAAGLALVIVAYFMVITVWLPSFVLEIGAVSRADDVVQDIVATVIWGGGLAVGMWLLRVAQKRNLI